MDPTTYTSIIEGSVYDPRTVLNIISISSYTERTLVETEMGLITENYETKHNFHIVGDRIRIPYGGVLGQDFFITKSARIDYNKR